MILIWGENEEHDNNFASNEPQVKLEHIFPGYKFANKFNYLLALLLHILSIK